MRGFDEEEAETTNIYNALFLNFQFGRKGSKWKKNIFFLPCSDQTIRYRILIDFFFLFSFIIDQNTRKTFTHNPTDLYFIYSLRQAILCASFSQTY